MTVTTVIIGAGNRGKSYSQYATENPSKMEIVGVAEPREHARKYMQKKFNIPDKRCYNCWLTLSKETKFADCAIITTQDKDHLEPTVALAKKGYNILLEKPMAVSPEDCKKIYNVCKEAGVILTVCHVLRYHPCVLKIKELIDFGVIGEVANITHTEPVGFWHFAHSFVRGNWGNEERSTFSLLSKCCHDVDLIRYWMEPNNCIKVSSFGSLQHFKRSKKPDGAGMRCLDCKVEKSCPYSAKRIYLNPAPTRPMWPMSAVCDIEDAPEGYLKKLTEAVNNGPYGKCVYETNNDVCDTQVVNFEFCNGATATLTMVAFTKDICSRKTNIYGSKGQLQWDDNDGYLIKHHDFLSHTGRSIRCLEDMSVASWGHAGTDYYLIKSFIEAVKSNGKEGSVASAEGSVLSHLLAFSAETSRKTGKIVDCLVEKI